MGCLPGLKVITIVLTCERGKQNKLKELWRQTGWNKWVNKFSCSVTADSLQPHGLQHTRPPCPSPTPTVHSNSCPLSRWCHPAISSSVVPFSSRLQSFPASGSSQMIPFFTSGGQSIGLSASASVCTSLHQSALEVLHQCSSTLSPLPQTLHLAVSELYPSQ